MKNHLLTSFLVAATLLAISTCPAFAQSWVITTKWEGTKTVPDPANPFVLKDEPWLANGNNVSISNQYLSTTGGIKKLKSSGSVTFTYTWDSQNSGVPAPPNVILVISGGAEASVRNQTLHMPQQVYQPTYSASTTLGVPNVITTRDPATPPQFPVAQKETKSQSKVSWEKIAAGGSFTKTYSLGGEAEVIYNGNGGTSVYNVSLSCGISIHATPYNFRRVNQDVVRANGALYFLYEFNSTSGSLVDLASVEGYEYVDYPGSALYFMPPPPFFHEIGLRDPTMYPNSGARDMRGGFLEDTHHVVEVRPPYSTNDFSADQKYVYDDLFTGELEVLVPSPTGDNTATIRRTIEQRGVPYIGWWYSCSKQGFAAWLQITTQ